MFLKHAILLVVEICESFLLLLIVGFDRPDVVKDALDLIFPRSIVYECGFQKSLQNTIHSTATSVVLPSTCMLDETLVVARVQLHHTNDTARQVGIFLPLARNLFCFQSLAFVQLVERRRDLLPRAHCRRQHMAPTSA